MSTKGFVNYTDALQLVKILQNILIEQPKYPSLIVLYSHKMDNIASYIHAY